MSLRAAFRLPSAACLFALAFLFSCLLASAARAAPGDVKWKSSVGTVYIVTTPAIGDNGMIYFGSGGNMFLALNATTGEGVWNCTTGNWNQSSPAIGGDGTVYFGSRDHYLYALNGTNGTVIWKYDAGHEVRSSPALGGNGLIYVGSYLNNALHAVNASTGKQVWNCTVGGAVYHAPAIGSDGTVYFGSDDRRFYAVNGSTGAPLWNSTINGIPTAPAVGGDGTVYLGSDVSRFFAFNGSTGASLWNSTVGGTDYTSAAVGGDGTVYFGSNDHRLYALNGSTGAHIWNCTTDHEVHSTPAIGSDGTVYFGSKDNYLYAVNGSTGGVLWKTAATAYSCPYSPAIDSDGTVYTGGYQYLYAIESASRGLAVAPWPKYKLNGKGTCRNHPPTANAGADDSVKENTTVTLNGLNSADPDGTIAIYAWTQTSGASATLSDASSSKPTFTAPRVGSGGDTLTFRLAVRDNNLARAEDSVSVTVTEANTGGPTADAGPDQTVREGAVATLDGSNSTDPDSNITAYAWTQTAGTSVSLADASAATTTFTAPSTGTAGEALTFRLKVTDAYGLSSTDTVIVNVSDYSPPTADAGEDRTVAEGTTVTLSAVNSTDTNGTITAYQWSQTSGATMTLSATDLANATFVAPCVSDNPGLSACVPNGTALVFKVTVTDNDGLQASDSATVTVAESGLEAPDGYMPVRSACGGQCLGLKCSPGTSFTSIAVQNASEATGNASTPGGMPYGLVSFTLKVATAGDAANVTVALPEPAAGGASWYKWSAASGWYDFTANTTFSANRSEVTIHLVDGGAGDSDGAANGVITDPSGLVASGSSGSGSSGCLANPGAGFGLEWLLLALGPAAVLLRGRRWK